MHKCSGDVRRNRPGHGQVTNPEDSVRSWWSTKNVHGVTNLAVTGGWKKPFR
jgi:hypothetical protein